MRKVLYYADFHLHSKYARATSINMDLEHITEGARAKGLNIIGTGDFSHPAWFSELKKKLVESDAPGFYELKNARAGARGKEKKILFALTNEVSTIISTRKGVKKVHHVIHAPSLEEVAQLNDVYAKLGDLSADGRPTFGNCSPAEIVEKTMGVSRNIIIVPAHYLTPWFGCLGSFSGYDSVQEAYEDQVKHIIAVETGLSSDPAMGWRISSLDKFAFMSNSDSHSPNPARLGRECNIFDLKQPSFNEVFDAVRKKDGKRFLMTCEFFPEEGKYHWDGHRNCGITLSPEETRKLNNKCPVCKRPLTLGVMHRVLSLADRPKDYVPPNAIPFKHLIPLTEILSDALNTSVYTKTVQNAFEELVQKGGSELKVLLDLSEDELKKITDERIALAIMRVREEKVVIKPGYDGVYGEISVFEKEKLKREKEWKKEQVGRKQKSLQEFFGAS